MPRKSKFYVILFNPRTTSHTETSRTFVTLRVARKQADAYRAYSDNVRIMLGGPGGVEVK